LDEQTSPRGRENSQAAFSSCNQSSYIPVRQWISCSLSGHYICIIPYIWCTSVLESFHLTSLRTTEKPFNTYTVEFRAQYEVPSTIQITSKNMVCIKEPCLCHSQAGSRIITILPVGSGAVPESAAKNPPSNLSRRGEEWLFRILGIYGE
jgi:hypothetical protein